ncbi:MAG: DUF6677 family protein [Planctomycetota bacterium]
MSKITPSKLSFLVAGWLVPGLGHYLAGWRRKGVILFLIIATSFLVGLELSDWEAVSRDLHEYAFYAEIWVGGATLPLLHYDPVRKAKKVLHRDATINQYEHVPRYNDTGVLFCAVAGLLNLLVLFDLAERMFEPRRAPEESETGAKK